MRLFPISFILLALLCLGGCFSGQIGGGESGFILQGDYYTYLEREYQTLADFEREQMKHEDDAALFSKKARAAHKNVPVAPERPADHKIPANAGKDLDAAHRQLTGAIDRMFSSENGPLLAIAQTRFDCWLIHQEDFPQENAHIACRDKFYEAMGQLVVPESEKFDVYFDSGETMLDDASMDTLRDVASRFRGREYWKIMLAGYTDGKGSKSENRTLSLRRAVAVRNALVQQGVSPDDIAIKAEGAVSKSEDADSRRVEITFHPRDEISEDESGDAFGWAHSGDL